MTPERWQQVEKIYHEALKLEPSHRAALLKDACAGDKALRQEVESLLRSEPSGDRFIEEPALEVAAKMFAQEEPQSLLGQQLGSYQILSLLGTGGMGVVYKARDTRLKRSVALKVLPADQVSDPERKRRFIQEARAASALNHPNIITVHDIGSEGGIDFVVMEYVKGKTLDQLIPRKGLRLNETLKLSIQMADALAKAHSAGIVHRDMKPTNVMVTDDGLVKVLDFGLAKLTEVENDEGGTRTTQLQTEEGTIVGTVSYMSPEQAEGKKVDARSDIFSFGSVLYEMVTGRKAFQGDTKLSTLTAILREEPKRASEIVQDFPRDAERIISHCLRKEPSRRFQHMDDVKVELEELKEETHSDTLAGTTPAVRPTQRIWIWVGAALVVVVIAITGWLFRGTAKKPAAAPEVVPLTTYAGFERSPSFSPDGNQVAFSWNGEKQDNFDIYIKLIGSASSVRLTTDPADDISPAFSPDGRSIGFLRTSKERTTFIVIPSIGGSERIVADIPFPGPDYHSFFAWLPDGKWVVTDGLALLSTESGETHSLTSRPQKPSQSVLRPPPWQSALDFSPAVSPDGRTVAFSRWAGDGVFASDIYLLDLTEDLKPKGEPRRLTSLKDLNFSSAWAPNGRDIIFESFFWGIGGSLWKVEASGLREPERLPFTVGAAGLPAISPSGNRLVYEREVLDDNIWRLSLSGPGTAADPPVSFIASTRMDSGAQYSPDGKQIVFVSDRSGVYGIWVSNADGSKAVELFSRPGASCGNASWSPDGQRIAFDAANLDAERSTAIYVIRASGGKPVRLTSDTADHQVLSWSKDGNWIYFASRWTGRFEVWKVSAGGGEALQVTRNGGGTTAFESPDGKSIYYIKGWSGSLWKMPVSGGEESEVLPSVVEHAFFPVKEGIYFIPESGSDRKYSIQFLSFATAKVKTVAPMSAPPAAGLSVSPDGRSLLFSQVDAQGSDLMLVDNFP